MAPDGSALTPVSQQPGAIFAMDTDPDGNVYVASTDTQSPAVQSVPCQLSGMLGIEGPSDIIAAKLQPDSLAPIYSTRLAGRCGSQPFSIHPSANGSAAIGLLALNGFTLWNPVYASAPSPGASAGAVVELAPDGTLVFSTDLPWAAAPAALGPDGSIYTAGPDAILRLPVVPPVPGMIITGAFNAFDGTSTNPSPGMLLTITGKNLSPDSFDVGLNYPDPLRTVLGDVEVLFDGNPGEVMQIAPDHVICVIPSHLSQPDRVAVRVATPWAISEPIILPIGTSKAGLLTQAFPALPPPSAIVDGNIRNEDGTLNSADNPAASGSTVTLFGTGAYAPGPIYLPWNSPVSPNYGMPPVLLPGIARPMGPGFIDAIYAIDFIIPPTSNPGRNVFGTVASGTAVYVK
jgi:uncharacterized protein (TIGR03437 family)